MNDRKNQFPITVVHGETAKSLLDEQRLQALTEHVVRHTTDVSDASRTRAERVLDSVLSIFPLKIRNKLERLAGYSSRDLPNIKDAVDYVRSIRDDNRLAVATVGGEVIGMLGYKLAGYMPTAENDAPQSPRAVYELCRASVLPKHSGQGVYKKLKSDVFDLVHRKFPDSPILSNTRDPVVKKKNLELGYKEISIDLLLRIQGVPEAEIPELVEKIGNYDKDKDYRWQSFLFDPLEK